MVKEAPPERFRKDVVLLPENTIYSFTIFFEPNQSEFPAQQYGEQFKRALQQASLFGNAMLAIRGHADPTWVVHSVIESGRNKGVIRDLGNGRFQLRDGSPFDPDDMKQVLKVIADNELFLINPQTGRGETGNRLRDSVAALKQLSDERANRVRGTVVDFAKQKGWRLDQSQIKAEGVGVTEPVATRPPDMDGAPNRRVEFRIVRVPSKARIESESDTDY
jgi:outer membrane protein OmpA-like peptidoglycan-associated protein